MPQSAAETREVVAFVRDAWLSTYVDEKMQMVLQAREFISRNQERCFWNIAKHLESGPMIPDFAGYKDVESQLYIFTDGMTISKVCAIAIFIIYLFSNGHGY